MKSTKLLVSLYVGEDSESFLYGQKHEITIRGMSITVKREWDVPPDLEDDF